MYILPVYTDMFRQVQVYMGLDRRSIDDWRLAMYVCRWPPVVSSEPNPSSKARSAEQVLLEHWRWYGSFDVCYWYRSLKPKQNCSNPVSISSEDILMQIELFLSLNSSEQLKVYAIRFEYADFEQILSVWRNHHLSRIEVHRNQDAYYCWLVNDTIEEDL